MSLQPKTRKYRYSFRNKTRISSRLPNDTSIRKLKSNNCFKVDANFYLKVKQGGQGLQELGHSGISTPIFNLTQKDKSWTFAKSVASFTDKVSQISITAKDCKQQDLCSINSKAPSSEAFLVQKVSVEGHFDRNRSAYISGKAGILKLKVDPKSLSVNKLLDASTLALARKAPISAHCSTAFDKIKFGEYGFYFCNWGTITAKYIETIRLTIARKLKKSGRFWIRVCPDTPVTARSAETRMGRGKGAVNYYEAKVRPGQMFMEFDGVPQETIRQIFRELTKKTNIQIKIGQA